MKPTDENGNTTLDISTEDLHRLLDKVQPGEALQLDVGEMTFPVTRDARGLLWIEGECFGPRLTAKERANTPRLNRIKWGHKRPRQFATETPK